MAVYLLLIPVIYATICPRARAQLFSVRQSTEIGAISCQTFPSAPECNAQRYDISDNIGYAGNGFAMPAVAKDILAGYETTHVMANANDGMYGNGASWKGKTPNSWIKIDLGCKTQIRSVRFGRDRTGGYADHNPGQISIFVAKTDVVEPGNSDNDDIEYTKVFQSTGFSGILAAGQTMQAQFTPITGQYVKFQVQNPGAAIDELEISGNPCLPWKLKPATKSKTLGTIACQNFAIPPQCNSHTYDASGNIAYSGNGHALSAVAKDVLLGYEDTHSASNVNDGKYGNGASWVSNSANSWIKIDLGCLTQIRCVKFGRDRIGYYTDRNPGHLSIFAAKTDFLAAGNSDGDEEEYTTVFKSFGICRGFDSGQTMQACFTPVTARYIKFQVENSGAAIDELEVIGAPCLSGKVQSCARRPSTEAVKCQNFASAPQCNAQAYDPSHNIAYAGNGFAKPAVAKDVLAGYENIYSMENANDGKYGNGASWVGNTANSWLKIDLGCITQVRSVCIGRDRTGHLTDRNPGQVSVFVTISDVIAAGNEDNDNTEYTQVFESTSFSGTLDANGSIKASFPPVTVRYVKIQVTNLGAAIDEVEIAGNPCIPGHLQTVSASQKTGSITCQHFGGNPQCNAQFYNTCENIAFAGNGFAKQAIAKDVLAGYETTHSMSNANDGKYGNGASWIGNSENSWVKIDLGCSTQIHSVRFGRDRTGYYSDRDPGQVSVFVARNDVFGAGNAENDTTEYTKVFQSNGFSGVLAAGETAEAQFPAVTARYVKVQFANEGAAIDEIEVLGNACIPGPVKFVAKTPSTGLLTCQNFATAPQCNAQMYDVSKNIAYAGNGFAQPAVAKDVLEGFEMTHSMHNANDGKYGNGASWVGNSANSWIKIDLGCSTQIRSIRIGRDRLGLHSDRNPGETSVYVAKSDVVAAGNSENDDVEYAMVFKSSCFSGILGAGETARLSFTPVTGRYVKIQVENRGAAIDEIEIEGNPCVAGNLHLTPATRTSGLVMCQNLAVAP